MVSENTRSIQELPHYDNENQFAPLVITFQARDTFPVKTNTPHKAVISIPAEMSFIESE